MALYLFNQSPVVYEHSLRPEAIDQFFYILLFFILLLVIKKFGNKGSVKVIILLNVFFVLNYFIFILQPRWGFTLALNLLLYVVLIIKNGLPLVKKIIFFAVVPVILSFILLYIPNNIFSEKSSRGTFLAGNLLFAHVKITDIEMKKDINDPGFKKYDKYILKKLIEYNRIEYNKKQVKHKYLGYLFNDLYYGDANKFLKSRFNIKEYKEFCYYYFFKSVGRHPFLYARKVLLELSQFYDFKGGMYPSRQFKLDADGYWHEPFTDNSINYMPYLEYIFTIDYLQNSIYDFKKIEFPAIEAFYFILSITYVPVLVIFLILFFHALVVFLKSRKYDLLLFFSIFPLILFIYNFCITFSNASVYCMDVARYTDDQFVYVMVSQILAIVFIIKMILVIRDNKIIKY